MSQTIKAVSGGRTWKKPVATKEPEYPRISGFRHFAWKNYLWSMFVLTPAAGLISYSFIFAGRYPGIISMVLSWFIILLTMLGTIISLSEGASKIPKTQWPLRFLPTILLAILMVWNTLNGFSLNDAHKENQNKSVMEEYGYSKLINTNSQSKKALVQTEDGENKEVDFLVYKGYIILFDDNETMLEKAEKIDAGNYSEYLKGWR